MAIERWVGGSGQGLTWGSVIGSSLLTSLANTNAILSNISITNGGTLDIFADVSISLASLVSTSGAPFVGAYIYPLNQDGTTYGDGRFSSSAGVGPPPSNYYVGSIPLVPSVTQAQEGSIVGITLPPGTFSFVFYNLTGSAFSASTNTMQYRTYNRSVI